MKRLLIISPYFPPTNAADMQRIRMSLPYFRTFGWDPEVVTVDERYSDMMKDDLLLQSIPSDIKIHKVRALNKNWTSKIRLGSLAFRSLWFYRNKVNNLLRQNKYDLIYFSTTQFPVCILGAYWKNKFGIPYVIDMQDPWYSDYYKNKPKSQRPPKYLITYGLHKKLEAIAMKNVAGLISVSANYPETLETRYPNLLKIPKAVITFGAFERDLKIAADNQNNFKALLRPNFKNIVYIGRGGMDMHKAIAPVFDALKKGLTNQPDLFSQLRFYFIGTSYAPEGKGIYTILPLAKQFEVDNAVVEITDRISYYHALLTLQQADALFIPGSDDPKYTASKIFPYLLAHKPLLAIFNAQSSAINILTEFGVRNVYNYDKTPDINMKVAGFFKQLINGDAKETYDPAAFEKYSAEMMTKHQCDLFNMIKLR
ncbi:MAG TPA: hypothetical protein VIM16_20615 [Mucilaginibacter sp.]|jgi:hypothetical protein